MLPDQILAKPVDGRNRLKTPSEFVNKQFRMNIRVADAHAQVGMHTNVK
jgi:hypothetical protein